tara:strand:- start:578 stop:811 length:234 start_codon:yes stop_codon:yes gene_type:complete
MKITQEMIKKIIKEEIQNLNEGIDKGKLFQSQLATKIREFRGRMNNQQVAMELEKLADRYRNAQSGNLPDLGLDKVY